MNLIHRHEEVLFSSDWHVLHRNIYWFVPEARAQISGLEDVKKLDDATFIQAEQATYAKVLEQVQDQVAEAPVKEFIFLGDLVFGLNHRRGLSEKLETIAHELPQFNALFEFLKVNGIKRTLILGNHDDYKLSNADVKTFYEAHFDDIVHSLERDNVFITHFPLGYSLAQEKTQGTPEEKFFRMAKTFKKLDQKLLSQIGDHPVINFHGHIHQGKFNHALPQVEYRNMAIDILALSSLE